MIPALTAGQSADAAGRTPAGPDAPDPGLAGNIWRNAGVVQWQNISFPS